jgi:crotonobetainyl-CoA:carnitine CoA-transferase CaiB-like acyl-CoA transferase
MDSRALPIVALSESRGESATSGPAARSIAGREPAPLGNDNVTASPSGTFKTGDGLLNIAANKQEQFEALCRVLEHPEWAQDPRFIDRHARLRHRRELKVLMEQVMAAQGTEHWWKRFNEAGVPAGPVYSVAQALSHPQVAQRGMLATFEKAPGVGRDIRVVRTGFKLNGEAPAVDSPPPLLGEHNDDVLGELGYSAEQIEALRSDKAI